MLRGLVLALNILALPALVHARGLINGSISGYVLDEHRAVLPGVAISATKPAVSSVWTTTTDATGFFRLVDLPPGEYTVSASLNRFASYSREGLIVRAGVTIGLEITLQLGPLADAVNVVADSPMLDIRSAATTVNIGGDLQRSLPLATRRNWDNLLAIAPAVVAASSVTGDLYYLNGSSFDSHVATIDGTNATRAAQNSTVGIRLSVEALEDVQVVTAGTDASAPLGTGLVINAVTKTGTNAFKGSLATSYQAASWNSSNVKNSVSPRNFLLNADAAIGGPIRPDKAWFFGTYQEGRSQRGISRTFEQTANIKALAPAFTPFDNENTFRYGFVKPTIRVSDIHTAMASYRHDVNPYDLAQPLDADRFKQVSDGGNTGSARLVSTWSRDVLMTLSTSFTDVAASTVSTSRLPSRPVHRGTFESGGRVQGTGAIVTLDNSQFFSDAPDQKFIVAADFALPLRKFGGRHEIGTGFYLDRRRVQSTTVYPNDGFVLEELALLDSTDLVGGVAPFHRQSFNVDKAAVRKISPTNAALYGQDIWRLTDRLTLTLGLRIENVRQYDELFDVRIQDSLDLAPHIGVNYGLGRSRKGTVRGSWARRREVQTFLSAGSNTATITDEYDRDRDGIFETLLVTPGSTAQLRDRRFDADRHQPYAEDLIVGYQHQMPGRTVFDINLTQRRFVDALTALEINGIYDGGMFSGYRDPALNEVYLYTNNRWNASLYRAFQMQISRQSAGIHLIAAYTRQWRHLTGTWQPNDPGSFVQPEAFANSKGLGRPSGGTQPSEVNSLSGTSMFQGSTGAQWQDHILNLGSSIGPWRSWSLALNYVWSSGPWSGPVVTRLAAPEARFGPSSVRLSNGRLVANPLATTLRFVGADRSEGQFALKGSHVASLSLGRRFTLRRIELDVRGNVFNIGNSAGETSILPGGNQTYSPNFRLAGSFVAPRAGQFVLRAQF